MEDRVKLKNMGKMTVDEIRRDIRDKVIRIETLLEESVIVRLEAIEDKIEKQGGRIRALEDKNLKVYSYVTVIAIAAVGLTRLLGGLLGKIMSAVASYLAQ